MGEGKDVEAAAHVLYLPCCLKVLWVIAAGKESMRHIEKCYPFCHPPVFVHRALLFLLVNFVP